jgi:hypothetical protein
LKHLHTNQEELQRDSKAYGPLFSYEGGDDIREAQSVICASNGTKSEHLARKAAMKVQSSVAACPESEDSTTGQQLKEKGIREVSEHNENWMRDAVCWSDKYARQFAGTDVKFAGEDLRFFVSRWAGEPRHPNAWGALINTLIKRNIIIPTGEHRQMKDSRSHSRSTPVYRAY